MASKLAHVFQSGKIGRLEIKNRILMAPMHTGFCGEDGMVTDKMIDHYAERAKGGVGMVIVEATSTGPTSSPVQKHPAIFDDKFIPGLRRVADVIHEGGAKAAIQLMPHKGRRDNDTAVSASLTINQVTGKACQPLDVAGIENIIRQIGEGARRVHEAGFDAIEIHGAHGYLVQDFLSPLTNKRNDAYGGDWQGRLKFAVDIIKLCRAETSPDFPILFRLFGDERVPEGLHVVDTIKIGKVFQDMGVDALDITSGSLEANEWITPSMYMSLACNADLAAEFKRQLKIPIITVGRIKDLDVAEEVLAAGKADFVNIGRALIADPFLPLKAKEGREVRRCISCLKCSEAGARYEPLNCTVNPAVSREKQFEFTKTNSPKKVVVIGGGPGGMEAALVAAQRGHKVKLFEAASELGGQLGIGSLAPAKEELKTFSGYLERQIANAGVKIKVNTKATPSMILREKPDAVILASGVMPFIPKIEGMEKIETVTYDEALSGASVGQKVVVIGGGLIGCEVALFLREKGKDVVLLEALDELAKECFHRLKKLLTEEIRSSGIKVFTSVKDESFEPGTVSIQTEDGRIESFAVDSVVIACGSKPNDPLYNELKGKVETIIKVGDCIKPRSILEATREGADAGFKL